MFTAQHFSVLDRDISFCCVPPPPHIHYILSSHNAPWFMLIKPWKQIYKHGKNCLRPISCDMVADTVLWVFLDDICKLSVCTTYLSFTDGSEVRQAAVQQHFTVCVEYSGIILLWYFFSLAEDSVEITQSARGTKVCPEVLVTLLWEQLGHAAPFERCSPCSLRFPHLLLTSRGAPALPRPCAASALPAGRAARQPPPHGEGKQTRLSGGLEPTVPGPGFLLLQTAVVAAPFRPRFAAARAEEEQGALPSVGGSGRAARSLTESKGRGRAGKLREAPGSPGERPPPGSSPARPGPARPRRPLPRWRGRAVRAGLRRRARLAGRQRERRRVGGDPPARERRLGTGEESGGGRSGGWGGHRVARSSLPQWLGPGGHSTVARPDRSAAGTGAVAVRCRRRCRPRLWRWLPAPRRTGSLLSSAPLNTRLSEGRGRRALPAVRREHGGSPRSAGGWRAGSWRSAGRARQPFPRALLGAAPASGAGRPRGGRALRPGGEGAAGRADSDKTGALLRFPCGCQERGSFPRAGPEAGGAAAGLGFQVGGRGPEPPRGAEIACSHAFLRGFLAFLGRGHSWLLHLPFIPRISVFFCERVCPHCVCSFSWEKFRMAVLPFVLLPINFASDIIYILPIWWQLYGEISAAIKLLWWVCIRFAVDRTVVAAFICPFFLAYRYFLKTITVQLNDYQKRNGGNLFLKVVLFFWTSTLCLSCADS